MVESGDIMTREFVMLPEFDKRWKELGQHRIYRKNIGFKRKTPDK